MNEKNYDVLIIGAGPAGSTTAILLTRSGIKVALTDVHKIKHFVIGESLPPECKPILEKLGLWNDFEGDTTTIRELKTTMVVARNTIHMVTHSMSRSI